MTDLSEQEAQQIYREAWLFWKLCPEDSLERRILEWKMDWVQPYIARGPFDPKWKRFAASLPDFLAFWEDFRVSLPERVLRQMMERCTLRVLE